MIQDLHSHSYYSFCGKDDPEKLVLAAIDGGIEVFGITDHNHGVGFARKDARLADASVIPNEYDEFILRRYFDHITLLKEKYKDKIDVKRGIEIATNSTHSVFPKLPLPDSADISFFDFCLIEHLAFDGSTTGGDLFSYAKRCNTEYVGIAHTNMFAFIRSKGMEPLEYFKRMADQNIFWEMNVSYDSTHGYKEHQYMLEFFKNEEQQEIIRKSGVLLSVGFDGHKVEDYLPERITDYCQKIKDLGIKMVFEK